jgi:hypothetical protein
MISITKIILFKGKLPRYALIPENEKIVEGKSP